MKIYEKKISNSLILQLLYIKYLHRNFFIQINVMLKKIRVDG